MQAILQNEPPPLYPTDTMGLRVKAELESFAIVEKVGIMLAPEHIGKSGGAYMVRMKEQTVNILVEDICGFYMTDPNGDENSRSTGQSNAATTKEKDR